MKISFLTRCFSRRVSINCNKSKKLCIIGSEGEASKFESLMVKAVMNGGDMGLCVYGLLAPQEALSFSKLYFGKLH